MTVPAFLSESADVELLHEIGWIFLSRKRGHNHYYWSIICSSPSGAWAHRQRRRTLIWTHKGGRRSIQAGVFSIPPAVMFDMRPSVTVRPHRRVVASCRTMVGNAVEIVGMLRHPMEKKDCHPHFSATLGGLFFAPPHHFVGVQLVYS